MLSCQAVRASLAGKSDPSYIWSKISSLRTPFSFYMAINISLYLSYAVADIGGGNEAVWLANAYALCTIIGAPMVAVVSDRFATLILHATVAITDGILDSDVDISFLLVSLVLLLALS